MNKAELLAHFTAYAPHVDTALLAKAFDYSTAAHAAQERASGEHYFVHCNAVAQSLAEWKMDLPTICAGLLHDVLEDTSISEQALRSEFGEEITKMVVGVTKLDHLQFNSRDDAQAENWRRMLLATAQDIRVIVIKLADRLHNMRTLSYLREDKRKRIAYETVSLYAPLAHRLGMFKLKSQLDDLAFMFLEPEAYEDLSRKVSAQLAAREVTLARFKQDIEKVLANTAIPRRILARTKSLYSIYMKMQRQDKPFEEIQDALGVRIITDTIANCYALLGIVHTQFKPVAGSFTDYISIPKMNLYRSLHTTVMGPDGELVEIQIRTEEMHRTAEYGIAAHWRYKIGEHQRDIHLEEKLNWLRQWMEWLQDLKSPREFLDSLKTDLDFRQVFVFTPAGEVKALPAGATPLDFAFCVHTEIGMACVGAQVNNKMVKLDYQLKSGDICRILTKKGSKPKKDWLSLVQTARARSKIRHYLREQGIVA
ncbi:MAG: bifunctional (p)ppGpp synthetase/guanosine-3',5'-bis(diphosphate) 3'-pyrophosphohydrolase [Elusimicrobia bacterium]|nr:bifunctional (p)ppGpp synthetase/guanosine-3',5'-bis(diphosphate) 3'-pyrophosphohydrolase [Elusimicrobiota bacterium]MDE2236499.1 bifunctional (p)ppGpp synthetase/guanosine-3',5'-bis(diphosphate) 3'-pyrophosphohydrolase [Elusimicrobiota bacterium]MDE2424372.1 bifunctional (p)ppGpp synthetase/guanosine-3',5'-bis(diphosphate) 3'-pyrophosphohydrolase [Elusimicrobiota bacterium]